MFVEGFGEFHHGWLTNARLLATQLLLLLLTDFDATSLAC